MSSKKSGYALFVNEELKDYGLWELDSDVEQDWRQRVAFMASHVNEYCCDKSIDVIYVEDVPPITYNTQTVKILSALQGMLVAVATQHNIKIEFVPVKAWKSKIGINLTTSKENNICKKHFKEHYGAKANRYIDKLKNATKAYEKKLSVDYVNKAFGLDLIYKSPSSKKNQDDIADAICIGASIIIDEPHHEYNFESIMSEIYDKIVIT